MSEYVNIQKRLVLTLKYMRILKRLTAIEVAKRTGVNFYLLETGSCPVSVSTILKLQEVFGLRSMTNLLCNTWHEGGIWTEKVLEKLIFEEETKWEAEKLL